MAFRSKGPVYVSACPAWSLVVALSMMSRVPTEADNLHTYKRWSGVEHWPIRWWPVYTVGCFCLNHISEVARLPYLWKCNRRLGIFDGIGLSRSGSTTSNKLSKCDAEFLYNDTTIINYEECHGEVSPPIKKKKWRHHVLPRGYNIGSYRFPWSSHYIAEGCCGILSCFFFQ